MRISRYLICIIIFFSYFYAQANNTILEREEHDFCTSFIDNYGFSINARDTHEYHSFVLAKTRESFSRLEKYIAGKGLSIAGRMVICGYQEDAIQDYYANSSKSAVNDEMSFKTKAGWHFAHGNLFGFITGFILKDVAILAQKNAIFEHHGGDSIGLFDDRALVFQKHAFGNSYAILHHSKRELMKALLLNDTCKALRIIQQVWKYLYTHDNTDGSQKIIATQDILFSFHYMRHLINSGIPLIKFFTGPDITFPIEVLRSQKAQATQHAQTFVHHFADQMKPVQDKKTAYIFCSFVDGVGKSTLLSNIKNWFKFGQKIECYKPYDNSSSQRATLYDVNEKVVIVDMPAQMSHFVIKPDGSVFVDIDTIKNIDDATKHAMQKYIKLHEKALTLDHDIRVKKYRTVSLSEFVPDKALFDNALELFAYQSVLAACHDDWVPCLYDKDVLLFDKKNINSMYVLTPLCDVHSSGLKNSHPEHMLFTKGISIPMGYQLFLDDVTKQLKDSGVQNIVFVDFMSMYPRTSRETIRVNFVLQQLGYMQGGTFDRKKSLYKEFMHPSELYLLLQNNKPAVIHNLIQETVLRSVLYAMTEQDSLQELKTIDPENLARFIKVRCNEVCSMHYKKLVQLVNHKVDLEYQDIVKKFGYSKDFQAIVRFDPNAIVAFSNWVQALCSKKIKNNELNSLWQPLQEIYEKTDLHGQLCLYDSDGKEMELIFSFDSDCRDKSTLKPFIQFMRAQWYALLSNLLLCKSTDNGQLLLAECKYPVVPCVVYKNKQGFLRVVRKKMMPCEPGTVKRYTMSKLFSNPEVIKNTQAWGIYYNQAYCLSLDAIKQQSPLYNLGYDTQNPLLKRVVLEWQQEKLAESYDDIFMPTSEFYKYIAPFKDGIKNAIKRKEQTYMLPYCDHAIKQWLEAIATLEMVIKDPAAAIMIQNESKKDFIAAIQLLETTILPYFCIEKKSSYQDLATFAPVIQL